MISLKVVYNGMIQGFYTGSELGAHMIKLPHFPKQDPVVPCFGIWDSGTSPDLAAAPQKSLVLARRILLTGGARTARL